MKRNRRNKRSGVAVIIALTCLAVVSVVSVGILRLAAQGRQQARRHERELQAVWLAESACARAAAQLALDAQYTGETWNVAAEELGGRAAGQVVIEVSAPPSQPEIREVRVVADVGASAERRARRSKQVRIGVGNSQPPEDREP
jgi:Tfp pilus assembly protein PilX